MEIVLATRNKKKVEEIKRILSDMNIAVLTLNDFPFCPEVAEDKNSFEGNAIKKAVAISKCTGRIAVSDDSGLEVYALHNAPGVMSSRYAGEAADDTANIKKLLNEMKDLPDEERGARFVCCISLAFPEGSVVTFWGLAEGIIGREPRGRIGFGYDPVFYPSGYNRTFAEMAPEEKDALSHRRIALEKFKNYLKNFIV